MVTTTGVRESASVDELVVRITETVAHASNTDPLALPPLERSVDTEALAALVESDGLRDLTFSYHDHVVTIDGDGDIDLTRCETPTARTP
jgi:hypothetical protein